MEITLETLIRRSPDERWQMYKNAMSKPHLPGAKELMALINQHQLTMTDRGGFPAEHPTIREIYDVCFSHEAVAAAIKATEEGKPAMAYVDPILTARVAGYENQLDTHTWAGSYVAQAMEKSGYKKTSRIGKLPEGCSAKTAMIFEKRR
jgi:hypothetical protein